MGFSPAALYNCLREDLEVLIGKDLLDFLQNNQFPPDSRPFEVAASSILRSFLKKLEIKNSKEQDMRAASKFMAVNDRCGQWTLQLTNTREEALYGEFKRAIYDFFTIGGFNLDIGYLASLDEGRCGPGASVMALGGDAYTKMFASPMSCTDLSLYNWYRRYIRKLPEWHNAEEFRCVHHGQPYIVVGNRLSFVPKDSQVSRSICTEPGLNMFYQLGVGKIFEKRLKNHFGIEMDKQPFKNRKLAWLGSKGFGYVTIDLSSASDSMSLRMLKECLPAEVLSWLCKYRSAVSEIPYHGKQELHMISTMGNGFTFPLQTALFSCVVRAAFRMNGVEAINPRGTHAGNWGVFGDDIACPSLISRDVLRLLDILGFSVNPDKTFLEGPFRESCGHDYFNGRNVRGVYVKRLRLKQDRYSVINQLNLFSTRTGIPLPKTVQALVRTVPWNVVPRWENDDAGIKVPSALAKDLPLDVDTQSTMYWAYRARGLKLKVMADKIKVPRGQKLRVYNPSGLWTSFIGRWLNDSSIGVRLDTRIYERKRAISPFWDYEPTIHSDLEWFNWQRWDTAVYINLYG